MRVGPCRVFASTSRFDSSSQRDQSPCLRPTPLSLLPWLLPSSLLQVVLRPHQEQKRRRRLLRLQMEQMPASLSPRRSAAKHTRKLRFRSVELRALTSEISFPLSSPRSLSRRSSSASTPTDSRTPLISEAEGSVLPDKPRSK